MKSALKILAIVLLSVTAGAFIRGGTKRFFPSLYAGVWGSTPAPAVAQTNVPSARSPSASVPSNSTPTTLPAPKEKPFPVGYLVKGDKVIVCMSDGTRLTEHDKELERVEKNSVTISGEKMFIRARPEPTAPGAGAKQGGSLGITSATVASVQPQQQKRDEGAWVRGDDGVARLRVAETLGAR